MRPNVSLSSFRWFDSFMQDQGALVFAGWENLNGECFVKFQRKQKAFLVVIPICAQSFDRPARNVHVLNAAGFRDLS